MAAMFGASWPLAEILMVLAEPALRWKGTSIDDLTFSLRTQLWRWPSTPPVAPGPVGQHCSPSGGQVMQLAQLPPAWARPVSVVHGLSWAAPAPHTAVAW